MAILIWTARLTALLGFLDATYLTVSHLSGAALACGADGGCEFVTTSKYATIGPVPIAAIGVAYYVVANLLVWTPVGGWSRRTANLLAVLTGVATLASVGLVYLQGFVIHAWCRYCLISASASTLLFLTSLVIRSRTPVVPEDDGQDQDLEPEVST